MNINWTVATSFDGLLLPTYGNYGGFDYTAGVVGGTTPENPIPAPVDALDYLFWQHDLVYQHVEDGLVPHNDIPTEIAQAD